MYCHQCGTPNREGARYCTGCGAVLQPLCASCRRILPASARFCPSCGNRVQQASSLPRDSTGALRPGAQIGNRYRTERLLGMGGFGAVYLARDGQNQGRLCAIKESFENSPEGKRQFHREANLLLKLSHPNLVRVYDFFETEAGEIFLVMDFIQGQDLDQLLEDITGFLPEARLLDWAIKVCDVLDIMHSWVDPNTGQGSPIIHRDIKPGNIKLQPNGTIMLIDLGIAKVKEPGRKTTRAAQAVSPPYSPLEQYGQGTDERSDIYSLGATLYHLATRREPPEAPDLAGKALAPPRRHNPSLSQGLEEVILRAMAAKPGARYQQIAEMRAALVRCSQSPGQNVELVRQTLSDALGRRKWVQLTYSDARGRTTRRTVQPTAVTPSYLVGYCELRQDTRRFLIRRISYAAIEETRPAPALPIQEGVYIRPISDRAARLNEPMWVLDPSMHIASGDWEVVPLPGNATTGQRPPRPGPQYSPSAPEPPPLADDPDDAWGSGWGSAPLAPQGPLRAEPATTPPPPPPPYDPAPLYQRGLDAYGDGQWQAAADLLAEVLRWQPGHRDALRLLRQARRRLYGNSPLDELYAKAERNLQRKQWNAAVKKLEEIYNTQPNYKDVAARLPEARRILKEHKRELDLARLYRQADAQAQRSEWAEAIKLFTRLARKQPRYRDTEQRILELSRRLAPGIAP